ncbi:MAG: hypothetical protein M0Q93_01055 [Terrimicrobiaceae bacterium]|jgi:hypothetical protein|nr:hypothetical protein [Terrimicrobiaceae bacterium]
MNIFEQIKMLLEVLSKLVENFKLVWAGIVILLCAYYAFEFLTARRR